MRGAKVVSRRQSRGRAGLSAGMSSTRSVQFTCHHANSLRAYSARDRPSSSFRWIGPAKALSTNARHAAHRLRR